jgi:hypothetical protein
MRFLELFSGTGSVGNVFRARGWEVISLDSDPAAGADVCADVLDFDYRHYPPGHFDCVWASPPCTHYSCARTTGGPRDLEGSDALVRRVLDIFEYFGGGYWMENPHSGLLTTRAVVAHLPKPLVVDYCMYADWGYRKRTALWTNAATPTKLCDKACPGFDGIHPKAAQRGAGRQQRLHGLAGRHSVRELYRIPPALVEDVENATRVYLGAPAPSAGLVGGS